MVCVGLIREEGGVLCRATFGRRWTLEIVGVDFCGGVVEGPGGLSSRTVSSGASAKDESATHPGIIELLTVDKAR